ncbi:GGDEF domain-containing protein [Peteryoungia desertarenae]|uniref:diguanylate cyclase n=1 Tax=Peteryoungia desertarenae TaxID=1813451 RepID=A0ABX6QRC8_9HYPH|nr:GGDEF domain-containing protein [Peteryoungia desertarenae]QLF70831.1 GGDEF domain-containing protein [Peteryoungia desertarenae]
MFKAFIQRSISQDFDLAQFVNAQTIIRFSLRLAIRIALLAALIVILALSVMDLFGILRYPLMRDLLIGVAITLPLAFTLTMLTSLYVGYGVMHLATTRREYEHLSRTDMLSGLLNRRAFISEITDHMEGHLLLLDIDRFKQVNDHFGHQTGDHVIAAVSEKLKQSIGPQHLIARLGGEEFAVFFQDVEDTQVIRLAERARHAIASTEIPADGQIIRVTVSGGLARRRSGLSFAQAYAMADRALYCAKASGRNRLVSERELDPVIAEGLPVPMARHDLAVAT